MPKKVRERTRTRMRSSAGLAELASGKHAVHTRRALLNSNRGNNIGRAKGGANGDAVVSLLRWPQLSEVGNRAAWLADTFHHWEESYTPQLFP